MLTALGLADITLTGLLVSLDAALASAVLLTAFALMVYVLTHNVYSGVGRAFTALMAFVTVVYIGDVAVINSVGRTAPLSGCASSGWVSPSCPPPTCIFHRLCCGA